MLIPRLGHNDAACPVAVPRTLWAAFGCGIANGREQV